MYNVYIVTWCNFLHAMTKVQEPVLQKPVIPLPGSKYQIITKLLPHVPKKYNAYYETFAGGLTLFLNMNLDSKTVYLNDKNVHLVMMYEQIQRDPSRLNAKLNDLNTRLKTADQRGFETGRALYIQTRDSFNRLKPTKKNALLLAAYFIFLVKSAFSCIYYVNKKGHLLSPYRVPSSGFRSVHHPDRIMNMHDALKKNRVHWSHVDFEAALKSASKGDFVYLDPPYYIDKTSIRYSAIPFQAQDHLRLNHVVHDLTERGCYVMISYGDHPFIRKLYSKYRIKTIKLLRNTHQKVGSKPQQELLILNY